MELQSEKRGEGRGKISGFATLLDGHGNSGGSKKGPKNNDIGNRCIYRSGI